MWKVRVAAARSTFGRQALLEVEMFKKCTRLCGTKHISKSKCQSRLMLQARLWCEAHSEVKSVKNWLSRAIFGSRMLKICRALWCETHFEAKCKTPHVPIFSMLERHFSWQAQWVLHLAKKAKREGFVAFAKTMAGVGHLKRICKHVFRPQAQYKRRSNQT